MMQFIARSISRKLMLVVLATTFMALLISAVAMSAYEIRSHQTASINDLATQADILGRVSAPALEFNDPATARGNLQLLKTRSQILAAAIYAPSGKLFASYSNGEQSHSWFPDFPRASGYQIDHDQMTVYHRIVENNEVIGTVVLRARYEIFDRLKGYLIILAAVMAGSLIVAAMIWSWLQAAVTGPIIEVTGVARNVIQHRDFSLRAKRTTDDEVGILVDAFNGMLSEVEQRAKALEQSNLTLEHEMKERLIAEEALRVADRRKDEFLATLAHELRNPLAPINSGLEIMRLTGPDSAASGRAREAMERQLRQMVRLVDDLLDVSRISTGKLAIRKAPVELQAVVRNAVETVASFIDARRHTLELALPDEPVRLDADATRLSQVFSNLLNNAAKYTDAGGRIALSASVEGRQAVVKVVDSGIGIPENMLESIFNMFTQVDHSLERSHAGLGVGLTLAKRLIELHGGTIEVFSGEAGKGSTFIVRLPLASDPAPLPAGPGSIDSDHVASQYKILLADDNVDFATSMAALLRSMGHTVHVTHDGAQALEAAGFEPDFAFLDIGLPKLNGYDLARGLREHPSTSRSVLVAVTGWGQEKDRQLAREAGFDHHMVKPVSLAQIQAVLRRGPA